MSTIHRLARGPRFRYSGRCGTNGAEKGQPSGRRAEGPRHHTHKPPQQIVQVDRLALREVDAEERLSFRFSDFIKRQMQGVQRGKQELFARWLETTVQGNSLTNPSNWRSSPSTCAMVMLNFASRRP